MLARRERRVPADVGEHRGHETLARAHDVGFAGPGGSSANDGTSRPSRAASCSARSSRIRAAPASCASRMHDVKSSLAASRSPVGAAASAASASGPPQPRAASPDCSNAVQRTLEMRPGLGRLARGERGCGPLRARFRRRRAIGALRFARRSSGLGLVQGAAGDESLDREGGSLAEDQERVVRPAARRPSSDGLVELSERERDPTRAAVS